MTSLSTPNGGAWNIVQEPTTWNDSGAAANVDVDFSLYSEYWIRIWAICLHSTSEGYDDGFVRFFKADDTEILHLGNGWYRKNLTEYDEPHGNTAIQLKHVPYSNLYVVSQGILVDIYADNRIRSPITHWITRYQGSYGASYEGLSGIIHTITNTNINLADRMQLNIPTRNIDVNSRYAVYGR